jgi:hypothetical protein
MAPRASLSVFLSAGRDEAGEAMIRGAGPARRHYSEEAWLDYARQQAGSAAPEMARHLAEPCARCVATVDFWQAAVRHAAAEPAYAPPEAAVRTVRATFATAAPRPATSKVARAAALVFDSFRQPALAGVRAAGPSPRQMLFRIGPYLVRLTLEPAADSGRFALVGQVLREGEPAGHLRDVPVLALSGRETVDRALTNELGEFEMEPEAADDLRLSVGVPEGAPLRVTLRATTRGAARPGVLGRSGRGEHKRRPGRARPRR